MFCHADKIETLVKQDLTWSKEDPLYVDQAYLDAHPELELELHDLTDLGKMFLMIFQTFAYLQIFNILNARRPSFKDINQFQGISVLTVVILILLLGFQFGLAYIPYLLGLGSITEYANLACMCLAACSTVWFFFTKSVFKFL